MGYWKSEGYKQYVVHSLTERYKVPRQNDENFVKLVLVDSKHTALRRKGKYWMALNQDNGSEWGNMSIRGLLFQ
jgi:hypothetical protein